MLRIALFVGSLLALVAGVQAQQPIQWISNTEQGISQARQVELPLMFYVAGSTSGAKDDDMKSAQQTAFRDPIVANIARERFVTVRLALSTQTKDFLEKLGAPSNYGNYLVFTTPNLELLGRIEPSGATQADSLARQMTTFFRQFRQQLFEKDLKAQLESPDTPAADKIKILKTIDRYMIIEADDSVAKVFESDPAPNLKKPVLATMTKLSTQRCVEALLKAAIAGDKAAAQSLAKCADGAAEYLVPKLKSENFDEFLAAYDAIVKICNLGKPKPKNFWSGKNQKLLDDEFERVETGGKRAAAAWRQKYEAVR